MALYSHFMFMLEESKTCYTYEFMGVTGSKKFLTFVTVTLA